MKRRASDERSRPVARQQRRRPRRTGRLSCFLAVLACGLVCYLVSVLHLFRAHAPPPRYPVGARTAAKMLSHAYDDEPKPKPSIIRPPQPKQPQPPADTCDTKRWRNDTDMKGGDLKGGMRAASSPAACCALCLRKSIYPQGIIPNAHSDNRCISEPIPATHSRFSPTTLANAKGG